MKKDLLVLFVISFMLFACAPTETSSLLGTTWKLTAYGTVANPIPAESDKGTITFGKDGKLSGLGACNEFSGDYEINGDQITLSPIDWGSEQCAYPQMNQESGVYEILKDGTASFKIEGDILTITSKNKALVFERVSE